MWWFNPRKLVVPLLLLLLAGCGFHPLHATDGKRSPTVPELASVKVLSIADRSGQLVRNALLDRLTPKGEPEKPRYILKVTLNEGRQGLGILKDETASRANYLLSAGFVLYEAKGRVVYSGSANSQASFNILDEHYASTSSEKNARDRTAVEVAEAIHVQLSAYFS
ncbi:MAG: hypothetical protein EPN26_00405, partial [Rhodospirillales bacterium]